MAKKWFNTVQNAYKTEEELIFCDDIFNVCPKAGYMGINRIRQMWDDNKIIGGSTNPADYGIASIEEMAEIMINEYKAAIDFTDGEEWGDADFSEQPNERIKEDLVKFLEMIDSADIIKIVQFANKEDSGIFCSLFPHELWLTRNHHGSGFWDNEEVWGDFAESLSDKARKMGECYATIGDDDLIYLD